MEISMLIEDRRLNKEFYKEHGLSIYIEFENRKILFDTGVSGKFIENANKMGITISDIDIVVISHAHIDHSGGLIDFFKRNDKALVYMSSKVVHDYYVKLFFMKKSISTPKKVLEEYGNRIIFSDKFTQLGNNIFIVSDFLRYYPLAKSNKNLLIKNNGKIVCDEFEHELVLVFSKNDKLVIINGCCHNGAENIIETVKKSFPGQSIEVLIGGFHLMDFPRNIFQESKQHIERFGHQLIKYDINKIYTCHCTGKRAFKLLKRVMGNKIDYFYTGMQIKL